MEMIQQLFMVAFVAFVFSILVEKLACVTINGDESKSKRTSGRCNESKSKSRCMSKSKSKSKSKKKVRFAIHDQIAIVVNNKLVKLDAIKLRHNKPFFGPKSYDLNGVYLGANWMGEELEIYKEFGLHLEHQELGLEDIQDQRELPNDKAQEGLVIDENIYDQAKESENETIAQGYNAWCRKKHISLR